MWTKSVYVGVFISLLVLFASAEDYRVIVGRYSNPVSADDPRTWIFYRFFPPIFTISVNDTVTFTSGAGFHGIVFSSSFPQILSNDSDGQLRWNNALIRSSNGIVNDTSQIVSSGLLLENNNFTFRFTQLGRYTFYDQFYPGLSGLITVQSTSPNSTQSVTQEGNAIYDRLNNLASIFNSQSGIMYNLSAPYQLNADGTKTFRVSAGVSDQIYFASFPYFIPSTLDVNQGDTVNFVNHDISIHTVHFNSSGIFDSSGLFTFENVPANETASGRLTDSVNRSNSMEPRVIVGSNYASPLGNSRNFTSGEAGSGLLFPFKYPLTNNSYDFTFTSTGNYPFVCLIDLNKNMTGTIRVLENSPTSAKREQIILPLDNGPKV